MKLTIRRPDDFHIHLRDGDMLRNVLSHTASVFARALVMPNLKGKPILNDCNLDLYRDRIKKALRPNMILFPGAEPPEFEPLMTIQINDDTTPEIVERAREEGAIAGKLYPAGVTTNSDNGVVDVRALYEVFEAMEGCGMVLCLHGETPGVFCMDAELNFVENSLVPIAKAFPNLKIVLEHATDGRALDTIVRLPNVAASITVHHLYLTLHDVVGGRLQPHNFCMPIAKTLGDRGVLVAAAIGKAPESHKFFLGTDSAPHMRDAKECSSGCAGVFSAPVAMPLLANLFEETGHLQHLEAFVSENGANFYGLPLNKGTLTLEKKPVTVPEQIEGVVPFWAGEEITWRISDE